MTHVDVIVVGGGSPGEHAARALAAYSDGPQPFGRAPQPGLWTFRPHGEHARPVVADRTISDVDR